METSSTISFPLEFPNLFLAFLSSASFNKTFSSHAGYDASGERRNRTNSGTQLVGRYYEDYTNWQSIGY